jgi:uncharacterized SAM-binding protein YcdF (DUF218 family)
VDCSPLLCSQRAGSGYCRAKNRIRIPEVFKRVIATSGGPFFFPQPCPMLNTKSRRTLGFWAGGAVLLSLLLTAVFYSFLLTALAKFLMLSQPPEQADLILVLGGDFFGPRAMLGAELGARGYAKKVLISGPPYRDQPESELSIRFLVDKGYKKELFASFPIYGKSTIEEAIALCPELRRLGAARVLIVTTAYHSRRANIVLNLFCPGIRFRSVPAPDDQFQSENWWKTPRYRKIFFSEWEKIIGTVFWEYPRHIPTLLWRAIQPS